MVLRPANEHISEELSLRVGILLDATLLSAQFSTSNSPEGSKAKNHALPTTVGHFLAAGLEWISK